MTGPYARIAAVLLVTAGCWVVWVLGGMMMDWIGLEDLDLIGRIVLVFAFLTVCQTGLERLSSAFNPGHQQ